MFSADHWGETKALSWSLFSSKGSHIIFIVIYVEVFPWYMHSYYGRSLGGNQSLILQVEVTVFI